MSVEDWHVIGLFSFLGLLSRMVGRIYEDVKDLCQEWASCEDLTLEITVHLPTLLQYNYGLLIVLDDYLRLVTISSSFYFHFRIRSLKNLNLPLNVRQQFYGKFNLIF